MDHGIAFENLFRLHPALAGIRVRSVVADGRLCHDWSAGMKRRLRDLSVNLSVFFALLLVGFLIPGLNTPTQYTIFYIIAGAEILCLVADIVLSLWIEHDERAAKNAME
jgi:protein-S-isoprenylcysteine O-methyltransferase Ste14